MEVVIVTLRRQIKNEAHLRKSFLTLINAPAPPSSVNISTRASVCWYKISRAAEDDFPSDTGLPICQRVGPAFGG